MSRSLRYENKVVIDHLASQYVAGALTPLVRRRIETLRQNNASLDQAVAQMSDAFSELHDVLTQPDFSPVQQENVWQQIQTATQAPLEDQTKKKASFWENITLWRGVSFASIAMLLLTTFLPMLQKPTSDQVSPAYFASLSPATNTMAINSADKPVYVISVYKGDDTKPSTLVMQWVKNSQDKSLNQMVKTTELHIWSENKDDQALVYIGQQPKANAPIGLTKASWQSIKNSRRLLITTSASKKPNAATTRFSGICLQLKSWKT